MCKKLGRREGTQAEKMEKGSAEGSLRISHVSDNV